MDDSFQLHQWHARLDEGADLVNDVTAGRFDADMLPLCARTRTPVILMHMQGTPVTMQRRPRYTDVVRQVRAFLAARARAAEAAGVPRGSIILDPGIGFGKTTAHNCRLLRRLDLLVALRYPVLVGVSRKGFIGQCWVAARWTRASSARPPPSPWRWPAALACCACTTSGRSATW